MKPSLISLVLAGCLGSAAKVEVIAVGAEIEQLSGDDAYTGSTNMDFLLYVKQAVVDESRLNGNKCPDDDYLSKSPRGNFSLKLVNAQGSPNIERTDFTECPTGAEFPGEGFWCRTFSKSLSYTMDTQTFPFDYQEFRIDLQDDGPPPIKKFCYMESVSQSANFDTSLWSTTPTFSFEQRNQSYPPNRDLDARKRSKCSFIWKTQRSWHKSIPRFCMVPLGVIILCVAILALKGDSGKSERVTAVVGLIWKINTFYSSTMQGLSLRSKDIGIFESFIWWNYLVILIISVDSCYTIISQAQEREDTPRRGSQGQEPTETEDRPKFDRQKYDRELRWLILGFSGLQACAVVLAVNIPPTSIGNVFRNFFRGSLFYLQAAFLICVVICWILLALQKPALVEGIGQPCKRFLWRWVTRLRSRVRLWCWGSDNVHELQRPMNDATQMTSLP
eukprot:Skav204635  [mRNA]  locus=scaffold1712:381079:382416:- [translate_table: standard]